MLWKIFERVLVIVRWLVAMSLASVCGGTALVMLGYTFRVKFLGVPYCLPYPYDTRNLTVNILLPALAAFFCFWLRSPAKPSDNR